MINFIYHKGIYKNAANTREKYMSMQIVANVKQCKDNLGEERSL